MLLETVTLNLCRCETVNGIKIDITIQYKYIISTQKYLLKFYVKYRTSNAIATYRVIFVNVLYKASKRIRVPR